VTGAGGFIGSHLTEKLALSGAKVKAFLRYNSRKDIGLLNYADPHILENIELVFGDLRDSDALQKVTQHIHTVFHLGAIISIPYTYIHPKDAIETNILGTTNILLASLQNNCEKIIHTSTSEVYGSAQYVPIDEQHPLHAQSPYAASKIAADKIAESFYCTYDMPVVTIRPFNTYGPRQSARAVIPAIISQILSKDSIQLGNLKTTRDFTFVDDTVDGFLQAGLTAHLNGKTLNLGVGEEISIGDLTQKIAGLIDKNVKIESEEQRIRPPKSEVSRLLSDNCLAEKEMNWTPKISLDEGLTRTIQWLQNHLNHYDVHSYVY
jgi:dTDP-glucose 4,6-dehydratase